VSNDNPARQLRLSQIYGYVRDGTITVVALTLLVIESLGEPDTEVLLAIMALLGAAPVLRAGSTVRKILNNLESGR
jgi:hypothetical protein